MEVQDFVNSYIYCVGLESRLWLIIIFQFSNHEPGQLFSESYFNVAVMFASLPNYIAFFSELDDTKPLNILHEIISKFDQVMYIWRWKWRNNKIQKAVFHQFYLFQLMYGHQFDRIEKIKIIGSTFMAACGLLSGRKNSQDFDGDSEPFSKEGFRKIIIKFIIIIVHCTYTLIKHFWTL